MKILIALAVMSLALPTFAKGGANAGSTFTIEESQAAGDSDAATLQGSDDAQSQASRRCEAAGLRAYPVGEGSCSDGMYTEEGQIEHCSFEFTCR